MAWHFIGVLKLNQCGMLTTQARKCMESTKLVDKESAVVLWIGYCCKNEQDNNNAHDDDSLTQVQQYQSGEQCKCRAKVKEALITEFRNAQEHGVGKGGSSLLDKWIALNKFATDSVLLGHKVAHVVQAVDKDDTKKGQLQILTPWCQANDLDIHVEKQTSCWRALCLPPAMWFICHMTLVS